MAASGALCSATLLRIQVEEVKFAPQQHLCVHLKPLKAAQADSGISTGVFFHTVFAHVGCMAEACSILLKPLHISSS